MNVATTVLELDAFLEQVIDRSLIDVEVIEFSDQSDWSISNGALSHRTGGFFEVIGIEEDFEKEHLMLYQPQSALTGLAVVRDGKELYVLLQVRMEPGNTNRGQYGPTIQSTPANYLGLHGGRRSSLLDLFYQANLRCTPCGASMQLDLGTRYLQKSKWHNYVLVDEFFAGEDHMIWVSLHTLTERLEYNNYLNADLRSLLSVFNWNKLFSVQTDLELPDHSGTMIRMLSYYRDSHSLNYKLKSLQELKGWNIRPDGIIPLDQKDVAVKMYYTNCLTREVPHWCQPLMSASSQGRIILLTRENNDGSEFLLTMRREAGIEGGYLMDVSDINYPGEDYTDHLEPQQVILHEFIQCDEGGRFYQHESIYRVILTDRSIEITDKQVWVSLSDLKYILGMSNVASIQLRCIASLFIMQMNKLLEK